MIRMTQALLVCGSLLLWCISAPAGIVTGELWNLPGRTQEGAIQPGTLSKIRDTETIEVGVTDSETGRAVRLLDDKGNETPRVIYIASKASYTLRIPSSGNGVNRMVDITFSRSNDPDDPQAPKQVTKRLQGIVIPNAADKSITINVSVPKPMEMDDYHAPYPPSPAPYFPAPEYQPRRRCCFGFFCCR